MAVINGTNDSWIGCLTYKSIATSRPGSADLQALVGKARARNRSMDVTGMLLFEDGCFLQTLEGPPDKLDALWTSIKRDTRHDHIEVLSEHIVPARLFSDWDLLLYSRLDDTPPPHTAGRSVPEAISAHIKTLVRLALDADDIRLNALIASLAEQGWTSNAIVTLLIEPTACAMGDAWLADDCSEIDLTIGLSMLQLAGHAVRYSPTSETIRNSRYSILLATAPGEPHMLGTSLLADQFTDAGWRVDMAFPDSNEALANQLKAQHPDAVDIGLSDALPREHSLERLRGTIKNTRLAGADHPAVISVGGRLFAEALATAQSVGADYARKTASGASIRMAELVQQSRKARSN
jgi:blue light- and temperature-responsive anti-repressor